MIQLEDMLSFVLQGWRSWKSAKALALLAAVALAVGIGSTTAIYTVVHAVLMKPLAYQHGERWVALFSAQSSEPGRFGSLSGPDLRDYRQRTRSFDVFGWYTWGGFNLTAPGKPKHIQVVLVTPALADNLGVQPAMGRWFRDAASEHGDHNLALISDRLWKSLGAKPEILGAALTLSDKKYTITGVMPPGFRLPVSGTSGEEIRAEIWIPLDPEARADENAVPYFCYARMKPGLTFAHADTDVKRIAREIASEHPAEHHGGYTAVLVNLRESVVKEIRPTLLLLFGAAGLLLLITCANVAGLLLARSLARARETAIRVALGAARWQLALHYFTEALSVSLAGAAGGVFLSFALVRGVISMAADQIPRSDEIAVNWTVLLFALGAGILAAVLSSFAPLWQAFRTQPNEVLSNGVRASESAGSRKLSHSLVIAEIALAFTLLSVSSLLLVQLTGLIRVRPGFDPDQLLTFQLNASQTRYPDVAHLVPYQKRLLQSVESIPGVSGTALVNQLALAGCCYSTTIYPEGRIVDLKATRDVSLNVISPGYFRTMRIPLIEGRVFDGREKDGAIVPVIIDQAAAKQYWPGRDAMGDYCRLRGDTTTRFQVIGVVGNVRNLGLNFPPYPEVFLPNSIVQLNTMNFVVRSPLPPQTLVPTIRRAIRSINSEQPIHAEQTMNGIMEGSLWQQRLGSFMMGFFALAALLMATLGVYGVVAYSVRQRTVEFGTRMAIGAVPRDLLRLVLGGGLKMALSGIAIGAVAVTGATWLLVKMFGLHDIDPLVFVYSTATVAAVALLASFFPAWWAAMLPPMVAIRGEAGSLWQRTGWNIRQLTDRVSDFVSGATDAAALADAALVTQFVDASRNAESFTQALRIALLTLCETVQCESAWLLEKVSEQEYRCILAVPELATTGFGIPADGVLLSRLRSYPSPVPLTEGDLDTWTRWATEQKPQHLPEIDTLRKTGATLAMPLRAKAEISGFLLLGAPSGRTEYSAVEKRLLRSCAGQIALMIENGHLTGRIVEQEKLRRDVQLAAEVQRRLFPDQFPTWTAGTLAAASLPARSVGGDYYDFFDLGEGRLGIALADVAGKGIAAALIMSVVQASLRIIASEDGVSLANATAKLNRFLYRSTRSSSYATFFYAQLDSPHRQLRYVNAGHNPPYLLRVAGPGETATIDELSTGGTIIGMFPQMSYEEAAVNLRPGDVLLIFTDGVPEALSPAEEEFGEDRLRDLLRQVAHLSVEEMAGQISQELKSWIDDAEQYDDLTFILVKVN